MIDYNFWMMFIGACIALNIAPGPDIIYILSKTLSEGKVVGIASSAGVCTGALVHVAITAAGLSTIFITSPTSFTIIKYIGASYLLYLAFLSFKNPKINFITSNERSKKTTIWRTYKQGILIDILNPKVAIFFMAFLPQFLREGHGPASFQLIYLGIIVVILAFFVESSYVLLTSIVASKISEDKNLSIWLNRIVGTIFIALGIKLVVSTSV